jgi:hypothetical protein
LRFSLIPSELLISAPPAGQSVRRLISPLSISMLKTLRALLLSDINSIRLLLSYQPLSVK